MLKTKREFYWIYIMRVKNGHFYTGYTSDLSRRYHQHRTGTGNCKYTRSFHPIRIEQCWKVFDNRSTAMRIERFIKGKTRNEKEGIIKYPYTLRRMIQNELNLNVQINSVKPARALRQQQ